jgi:hypothetical protein
LVRFLEPLAQSGKRRGIHLRVLAPGRRTASVPGGVAVHLSIDAMGVGRSLEPGVGVLADLRKFVRQHRSCGVLAIHLEPPGETAYCIEITCRACATALSRTVDRGAASWDLVHTDLLLACN